MWPRVARVLVWVLIWALAVYGGAVLCGLLFAPAHFLPAEDVVILHQYSVQLAKHGSIAYYTGGPHAEGATDFGWMVLLAGAVRLGIAPVWFTSVVNAMCLVAVAWHILRLGRVRPSTERLLALCGAAGLLPVILAAVSGFPVLPYALLLTLLWRAALAGSAGRTAFCALLLCLFRPDGVVFAVPVSLWLLYRSGQRTRVLGVLLSVFILPGLLYFFWRAWYFDSLLPLPFLVKADTPRFAGVLVWHSVLQSLKYLLLLLFAAFSLRPLRSERKGLLVCLVAVPTAFFWTMRLDQNVGDRFFVYLPLVLALLVSSAWAKLPGRSRLLLFGGYLLLLLGPFLREIRTFRFFQFRNAEAIAAGLSRLPQRGVVLTTEAGFMAYASGWVAVDAWGLNTARFARHLIQPADVETLQPDLIVLHPPLAMSCRLAKGAAAGGWTRTWDNMTRNILVGAHGMQVYRLWQISYGSEFYRREHHWPFGEGDRECFLVRQTSPLREGMESDLLQHHAIPEGPE